MTSSEVEDFCKSFSIVETLAIKTHGFIVIFHVKRGKKKTLPLAGQVSQI